MIRLALPRTGDRLEEVRGECREKVRTTPGKQSCFVIRCKWPSEQKKRVGSDPESDKMEPNGSRLVKVL